jgi:small subunit ribosomal protein S17e
MGSIRDAKLKKQAREIVEKHPDEVSLDFEANKKFLNENYNIYGVRNRNRIAGYIVRWLKTKDNTYEEIRRINAYKKEKRKGKKKEDNPTYD